MKSTYNTRRKSVSLTALGVQVPGRSRASTESKSETPSLDADARHADSARSPPSKRVKTSHSPTSPARPSPQRPTSRQHKSSSPAPAAVEHSSSTKHRHTPASAAEHNRPKSRHLEFTPPPSPGEATDGKIDYDAINDDIVEGVVTQLEKTGNRPHLIRELAAILATTNDSVTSSANAPALLSSRLASFMKRACWSAANPCPVGKELIPVHPRKVFYYLTDRARQELPDTSDDIYAPLGIASPSAATPPVATPAGAGAGIMAPPSQLPLKRAFEPALSKFHNDSPPLSTASATGDDDSTTNADERRERWAPSPSPEVDLSIHDAQSEYGDDPVESTAAATTTAAATAAAPKRDGSAPSNNSNSNSNSNNNQSSHGATGRGRGFKQELEPPRQLHLNTRAQSPRVEGDEREFRDTVFSLRASPTDPKEPPTPVENKMDGVVRDGGDDAHPHEPRRLPDYEMDSYTSGAQHAGVSSPAFPAQSTAAFTPKQLPTQAAKVSGIDDVLMADDDFGLGLYKWDLNAPKDISVDELDSLLEGC